MAAIRLNEQISPQRGLSTTAATFVGGVLALLLILVFLGRPLRRLVRESLMQRVTSTHYQILCPPGAMSQETMREFAAERETLFASLDSKLGDSDSNAEIQIIFDTKSPPVETASTAQPYAVSGTTIRTKLDGRTPTLDPAADAESLLQIAWGKRGNRFIGQWTAIWLVGERNGKELGIAATEVEQRLGHQSVATFLNGTANGVYSPRDRDVLGAAWVSEIAELGGITEVRKLYSAKMPQITVTAVSTALGATPQEIERQWQLWIYAYLAGMPPMPHDSDTPMDMPR
jgi:hypothetical protein